LLQQARSGTGAMKEMRRLRRKEIGIHNAEGNWISETFAFQIRQV
jgi:hypothetical protein